MSKQRLCRICKQRPPWQYKNCPPDVCKKCYHRHVWVDRPAARQQHQARAVAAESDETVLDNVLELDDVLEIGDVPDQEDDLASDDEALLVWLNSPECAPPSFLRNQRELHFRIALLTADQILRGNLIKNLQRLECMVIATDAETITGFLEYNPRQYTDRKATAQLHKLLNRWQRKGHLTWSAS